MVTGTIDLRGFRPESKKLTWRLLGRALPRYLAAFLPAIGGARVIFHFLPGSFFHFEPFLLVGVILALTLLVLDPWLRKQVGLTRSDERREEIWASSHEKAKLAARQAFRYLAIAEPIFLLSFVPSMILVTISFRMLGWH
jgi:hypothetical protein